MGKSGGGFDRYGVLIPKKSVEYTTQAARKIDQITFEGGWGLDASPAEVEVKYKLHGVYLFTPDAMIVEAMTEFANIGKIKRYKHGSIPGAFTTTDHTCHPVVHIAGRQNDTNPWTGAVHKKQQLP